jgi:hypothetical protein
MHKNILYVGFSSLLRVICIKHSNATHATLQLLREQPSRRLACFQHSTSPYSNFEYY